MIVKALIFGILVSFYLDSYSQETKILHLKDSQHFSEHNRFWTASGVTLYQEVNYNKPFVIDEEYCYYLVIQFQDNFDLSEKNRFDLDKDSALINVKFKRNSVWDWTPYAKINSGYVTVVSRRRNYIEIEFAFSIVSDRYNSEFSYTGVRKFNTGRKPKYFEKSMVP